MIQPGPGPCPLCGEKVYNWSQHYKEELDQIHRGFILPPRKRTRQSTTTTPSTPTSRAFLSLRANRIKRNASASTSARAFIDETDRQVASLSESCFMCALPLNHADLNSVNAHIDGCLARATAIPPTSPASSIYTSSFELSDDEDEDTYTWAGQKRVRVTSMYLDLILKRHV